MSTATVDTDSALHSFARTAPEALVPGNMREKSSWTKPPQPEELSENATGLHDRPPELAEGLRAILASGKEQVFEDGMESDFSKALIALIRTYGNDTLAEFAYFIVYEKVNAEVASEALRWLGLMNHPLSYSWRLWLLERSLGSSSARIRDGAALGLAFLDDPAAIPHIKLAIQREPVAELRQDLGQVLAQLESSDRCHSS